MDARRAEELQRATDTVVDMLRHTARAIDAIVGESWRTLDASRETMRQADAMFIPRHLNR